MRVAIEDPSAGDAQLAEPFGYQAPFASKYRSWLHKTGIAEQGLPLVLTETGNVVWNEDPALEKSVTMVFMHHELTVDPCRAQAWHFFVREFLPQNESFTREDVVKGLSAELRDQGKGRFELAVRQIPVIARKLLECYTQDYALGALRIIQAAKGRFFRRETTLSGPWQTAAELDHAYAKR